MEGEHLEPDWITLMTDVTYRRGAFPYLQKQVFTTVEPYLALVVGGVFLGIDPFITVRGPLLNDKWVDIPMKIQTNRVCYIEYFPFNTHEYI